MAMGRISIKRVYAPPAGTDGFRVLVDRLWPRGLSKASARVDLWLRDLGPSTALRKWFNHDPARWKSFCTRYRAELRRKPRLLAALREQLRRGPVTLLYGARDERFNQAVVLQQMLKKRATRRPTVNARSRRLRGTQPAGRS